MESTLPRPETSPVPERAARPPHVAEQREEDAAGVVEEQVNGMSLESELRAELDLHRSCAEGKLDELRALLAKGLEGLESLDMATGCTPIVLAIRNNHPDIVRELLSAGAIVPPTGLTSDPLLLSILYPQPRYGLPPQFPGQQMSPPSDFYPQQGPFPGPVGQRSTHMPFSQQSARKDVPNASANLPPAEVAKTIPCRNFPNCKYGAGCVFFHPHLQALGMYPGAPTFASNGGFDQPYLPFQSNGMSMSGPYPSLNSHSAPQQTTIMNEQQQQSPHDSQHFQHQAQPPSHKEQQSTISETTNTEHDHTRSQSVPSAIATPFVPAVQSLSNGVPVSNDVTSPLAPSDFGLSPLSPSMLVGSLPSIPPAEAYFATSPSNASVIMSPPGGPNTFLPTMHGGSHFRRQSFNQQPFGMPVKSFGHGKKLSFSGVPRPFGPGRGMGGGASWKDGNPPPCAFFGQGKCRNGEFCKFPHLNPDGIDCRHPDIINGIIPPLPTLSRQPRNMRMMQSGSISGFDSSFRHYPNQQQFQSFHQHRQSAVPTAQTSVPTPIQEAENTSLSADSGEKPVLPPSVPSKPTITSTSPIVRSISQPGVQCVHVNGSSSRTQSPAPSNTSFHGNGHPRRASSRAPYHNGANGSSNDSRSSSTGVDGVKQPLQRVPGAADFPALGGTVSSRGEKRESPVANSKPAAQVLTLPAPSKPVSVNVTSTLGDDSDHSVTMDSEPDSDAIIVSCEPSNASTSIPMPSPRSRPTRSQRGSMSFVSAGLSTTPPVSIKA